jgi:hypothetical protein
METSIFALQSVTCAIIAQVQTEEVVCAKFAHTTQHTAIKDKTQETSV